MVAVLYFLSAAILLTIVHLCVTPVTRRALLALVLLPLCFTARAVFTDRIYAPVELPYIAQPLSDHAAQLRVGKPHNGAISDIAFQMLPWREATRRALANGEWPLINPFELCGDVLADAAQPAVYNPFTLIACVLPAPLSFTYTGVITFFLAGLGAFLLARELDCSEMASLFAAIVWMFCGPMALQVLWPHGFAWALLPLILAATERLVREPDVRSVLFLAAALTLELLAGHPETALHVIAIAAMYGVVGLCTTTNRDRVVTAAVISGIVALALAAVQILPFLDAVKQTSDYVIRAFVYARVPLRVPAGFTRDVLLGDPFPWLRTASSRLPEDIASGSIAIALAIYAACFVRTRRRWFFIALFAVALLAGANAWPIAQLLHKLPLFRESLNERMATACPLAIAMLAAFAIDRLDRRKFALAVAALLIIDLAVALSLPRPVAGLPLLYADVIALVICLPVLRVKLFVPVLFALLIGQRIVADGSLIPVNDPRIAYPRLALLAPIESIREPFRIAGTGSEFLPNTATMYGLQDIRGHAPMRFGPLVDTMPLWSATQVGGFQSIGDLTRPFLSLMNVRFAFTNIHDPIPSGWHEVTHELQSRLIENERVLPRAFVPRNVRFGATDEVREMASETDFMERAWLGVNDRPHERVNGSGATKTSAIANGLRIDVEKHGDGFVVISQAAWRGYRAYVDAHRVTIHRANHAFVAVFVPNGRHTIELRYYPDSFVTGRAITLLTLALYSTVTLFARLRG